MNKLYYGDCLTIMQEKMRSSSVDLIYLDPPFNSNRAYNAIYKDETGRPLPDQVEAFCDMWTLDTERERAIRHMPVLMRESGIDDETVEFWRIWMDALRNTQPRLLAYLSYMVERLIVMKSILKPTGSIYLHCDPTASHYIKVMMDGVFGHHNFRNEIVWSYAASPSATKRDFPRKHDTIFRYAKSENFIFNHTDIRIPYAKSSMERIQYPANASTVMAGTKIELNASGKIPPSTWTDIQQSYRYRKAHMGYPTQKPLGLLERIIRASSNEGDVVFDPFCGCATTLEAAHNLNRRWIGVDIAIHAIKRVASVRLTERCHLTEGVDYEILGVPRTLEGAQDLWKRDKYHFQKWAVETVDGFVTTKRTADGGIDGRLYFAVPGMRDLQSMILEVKGGRNVGINDLRALKGVLDTNGAMMAGLIIMKPLSERQRRNFATFMAQTGDVEINGMLYSRMQMLSVPEILEGKRFQTPDVRGRHSENQTSLVFNRISR